jgi:tRNA modification GTPase
MDSVDTIFALSSGAPPAAIAIVRISGPCAFEALLALARRLPEPRRASLATLRNPADGAFLDQALLLTFDGPDTATGEDLAELHLHGGRAVVRAVEDALSAMPGLRRAQPGEFTRRAFANGRMDLNEAEGLADLLTAETEWQRRAAGAMMGGAFSKAVEGWRNDLLTLSALTEAELDFSDEDDVGSQNKLNITNGCVDLYDVITSMLVTPAAEKLRDGLRVVLGGPPNCGKSTLLNALVSREAAIVSDIAGTTRDLIEVPVAIEGIPFVFIDSAGVRDETTDSIEAIGIDRARAAFDIADIVLWLGDEDAGPTHAVRFEIEAKTDDAAHDHKSDAAYRLSARTGEGMNALITAITTRAKNMLPPPDQFAINARQRLLLADAASSLKEVAVAEDWLIVGEQLRQARLALDTLTGRAHTEDMLDALFGRFCVGK